MPNLNKVHKYISKCNKNLLIRNVSTVNSQKLIWFYSLEKNFLSTIICVPKFVASNYQKVITDI